MSVKFSLFLALLCIIEGSAETTVFAKPGCQDKCGEVDISYPFGITSNCSIDSWAELKCDTTFNPPKLFFTHSIPNEVVGISLQTSHYSSSQFVRIRSNMSTICFDRSGTVVSRYESFLHLNNTPFTLSSDHVFNVIGCYMYGVIDGALETKQGFKRGCATVCNGKEQSDEEQCNFGSGCCQIPLPDRTGDFSIHVETLNVSSITNISCGSAFLTDYNLKASDIVTLKETTVRLDFGISNQTCEVAKKEPSSFACKENSDCQDVIAYGGGYSCICNQGYTGNPYLDKGCQVVECEVDHCTSDNSQVPPELWILLGVGLGLFILGLSARLYYRKRKKLSKLSKNLARLKGRLQLIEEISSRSKIFTAKQLEQATNNFHAGRILGEGGYGIVYRGILPDQSIVAIKKSKQTKKINFDDFINEVAILTKIDHRNIVKLLGCSVDTESPMLVYEFVSNGTLSDHIFRKSNTPYSSMSWENRLCIAAEIAGALAYLHSAASVPIIHRDVKSSNILIDDRFTAKVADFGVSKVNYLDQSRIGTLVKGTLGYLDPEYMQTSQLTEKSDVFSFGVVLAELLTGKKSISVDRSEGERNLAIYFNASMNEERLLHIVEEDMVNEGNVKHVHAVAALVQRCVNITGKERPCMKEVASELEVLRGFSKKQKQSSSEKGNEDHTNLTHGGFHSSAVELTLSMMVAR